MYSTIAFSTEALLGWYLEAIFNQQHLSSNLTVPLLNAFDRSTEIGVWHIENGKFANKVARSSLVVVVVVGSRVLAKMLQSFWERMFSRFMEPMVFADIGYSRSHRVWYNISMEIHVKTDVSVKTNSIISLKRKIFFSLATLPHVNLKVILKVDLEYGFSVFHKKKIFSK